MTLRIANFKTIDAGTKCCEISIDEPTDADDQCFPVYWTGTLMCAPL